MKLQEHGPGLGLSEADVALIYWTAQAFMEEADAYAAGDRDRYLRDRSIEVLDELRGAVGTKEINHLMSNETLEPVYRYAYSRRPSVYPPPRPDK